jgi:hypothetical protein
MYRKYAVQLTHDGASIATGIMQNNYKDNYDVLRAKATSSTKNNIG